MTVAIVLAAGLGSRLAGAEGAPKWLVPVGAGCPAAAHLDAFAHEAVDRTVVVTGPEAGEIAAEVLPWRDRLGVELVPNDRHRELNNWWSLLLGLDRLGSPAEDVVVVNSDLWARPSWFVQLLDAVARHPADAVLAIDPSRGRTDEAMKVAVDEAGGLVRAIGKVGVDRPSGEYVGLARWRGAAVSEIRSALSSFVGDPGAADRWYEHAIQLHIDRGGDYAPVAVPDSCWVEIDDDADLARARRMAGDAA